MEKEQKRELLAKVRVFFDSRATWAGLGTVAGVMFGERIASAVNALGVFVMAVL